MELKWILCPLCGAKKRVRFFRRRRYERDCIVVPGMGCESIFGSNVCNKLPVVFENGFSKIQEGIYGKEVVLKAAATLREMYNL